MELCNCICLILCIVISVVFLFLLLSMDTLEPLEYGITYNKITKNIGTEVYENGRYIISPLQNFIVYPARYTTIEFSDSRAAVAEPLLTRTVEGLSLTLHLSFQYRLIKNKIPDLYNLANVNYQGTFVRISRDVLLKIAGNYNATSYWTERQAIGDKMREALDQELTKAYASVENLQIIKIGLPKSYEDSIVSTQVELQLTNMRKFEQTAELIRQNISVIISEADQKIKVTNAIGTSEAYRIVQYAKARNINNTIEAEGDVYKTFQTDIALKPEEFTDYMFYDSVMEKPTGSKLLVGLKNSIVSFGASNTPVSNNLRREF